jgi:hypothetical protein
MFLERKNYFAAPSVTQRPDHGETSYKGSGRLIRRKALIAGCDSGIGRAAAIAFARQAVDLIRAEERNWRGKELAGVPRAHQPLSHTI